MISQEAAEQMVENVVAKIELEASDEESAVTASGETGHKVNMDELRATVRRSVRAAYNQGYNAGQTVQMDEVLGYVDVLVSGLDRTRRHMDHAIEHTRALARVLEGE